MRQSPARSARGSRGAGRRASWGHTRNNGRRILPPWRVGGDKGSGFPRQPRERLGAEDVLQAVLVAERGLSCAIVDSGYG